MRGAIVHDAACSPINLHELTFKNRVLLVFLRHFGCTFCREALSDIAAKRSEIKADNTRVVLVHMVSPEAARPHLARYGLGLGSDVGQISDPEKTLYRAIDLSRGSLWQLFGPRVWLRGVVAGVIGKHWVGPLAGDGFQMPGAFVVHSGRVVRAYRHARASDRPDYCSIANDTQPSPT